MDTVREIMLDFADRTGLTSDEPPDRYLWTDAFATCNFLELHVQTGEDEFLDLAVDLVDQVHHVLGRHREDDERTGWISGLDDEEGERHPTQGGLRIGKPLPERAAGEAFDQERELDRDGQYYHYLTKWMHALSRVAVATEDATYNRWALELAQAAHKAFVYEAAPQEKAMHWKMSIDLTRTLVETMGQHDPLDGFVTYQELQHAAPTQQGEAWPDLSGAIDDLAALCEGRNWVVDDPLGLGGLLSDAWRIAQLVERGHFRQPAMLSEVLSAAQGSMKRHLAMDPLSRPAKYRLAFRELGMAIGLHAVPCLSDLIWNKPHAFADPEKAGELAEALSEHVPLSERIEGYWLEPEHQEVATWTDHRDINAVMLATSLAPEGYLTI